MRRRGKELVVSPTDLVGYLSCQHLTTLSLEVSSGVRQPPQRDDPQLDVLSRRGMEHEGTFLELLNQHGLEVVEIVSQMQSQGEDAEAAETLAAMERGADVVYQAAFVERAPDLTWYGRADFLTRVASPSNLGPFSYEPTDTKLARHVKPSALVQLCHYAQQVGRVQGTTPAQMHVVLGGNDCRTFRVCDFSAYYRAARARFAAAIADARSSYPNPVDYCAVCVWDATCQAQRDDDDHLTGVAGLRMDQARKLKTRARITTLAAFAQAENLEDLKNLGIGRETVRGLQQQARLQVRSRSSSDTTPCYELLDAGSGRGLRALPQPSPGDLFFDIEGDPYIEHDGVGGGDEQGGLEYLLGVGWTDAGRFEYRSFWAHNPKDEKKSFEAFVDFVMQRRGVYPDLHVYHYAPYEPTALGRLMGRHGTREDEIDELLRGDVLVDLYRVVRQGLRIGTPSYSLKKLEPLYMPPRTGAIVNAASSIVEYEEWLQTQDDQILNQLEFYNRTDCESTWRLRDWLELRRAELLTATDLTADRPPSVLRSGQETTDESVTEAAELVAALCGVGSDRPQSAAVAAAQCLLADLISWHRREDKPEWWKYFKRVKDDDADALWMDSEAITSLEYDGIERTEKQSILHRYRFNPAQEHKLSLGVVLDPQSEAEKLRLGSRIPGPGTLTALDPVNGVLMLKRRASSVAPHPRSLIPPGPVGTREQRAALCRIGRAVVKDGMDGPGPYRAVRDLVLGSTLRLKVNAPDAALAAEGEATVDVAIRLALSLDGGCLPIQGPPGSGKTYLAARVIVALVQAGYRVGITANSHAVITNLLTKVMEHAHDPEAPALHVPVRPMQKGEPEQVCTAAGVVRAPDNKTIHEALMSGEANVIAGTPWLFSRPDFDSALDYLIVDEAGQLSLANAVAVGSSARNLVLIGDPRQLAQPSKGTHPPGAGVSALDHLLAGAATIDRKKGLFLDRTRRLHPDICAFISEVVYEGRLQSVDGCERQRVGDGPGLAGSGLRWVPVDHDNNRTSSPEEVAALATNYVSLLGRSWTDDKGRERGISVEDILVVAPYNAQVSLLAQALPEKARVGTVDKFQGQEAAVVLISLAASSAEHIPRGMEFLYSRNRLNVAISRARALAVVFASPHLLAAPCRTVEQLRLVNGLCRFVELAS